jgi:pimeloyl-ACP methyl ester carboxylesterase
VTWAKLEALQVPALLITGDADLYTPPSVLRMFLERMKTAEWAIIPETGHSSYWESPELFNAAVLAFLGKR